MMFKHLLKHIFILLSICISCYALIAKPKQTEKILIDAFKKSFTAESNNNYQEAIDVLLKTKDESYPTLLRLASLYYLKKDYTNSVLYYSKCVTAMPLSIEALLGLCNVLPQLQLWDALYTNYYTMISLDSKNYKARYGLSDIAYNRKKYKEAKEHLDVLLTHYPFDYNVLILSAWNNYYLGNFDIAKTLFNKALLANVNSTSAMQGLTLLK